MDYRSRGSPGVGRRTDPEPPARNVAHRNYTDRYCNLCFYFGAATGDFGYCMRDFRTACSGRRPGLGSEARVTVSYNPPPWMRTRELADSVRLFRPRGIPSCVQHEAKARRSAKKLSVS